MPRLLPRLDGQLWMMLKTLVGPAELVLTQVNGLRLEVSTVNLTVFGSDSKRTGCFMLFHDERQGSKYAPAESSRGRQPEVGVGFWYHVRGISFVFLVRLRENCVFLGQVWETGRSLAWISPR